jgi:hypothetical protein
MKEGVEVEDLMIYFPSLVEAVDKEKEVQLKLKLN